MVIGQGISAWISDEGRASERDSHMARILLIHDPGESTDSLEAQLHSSGYEVSRFGSEAASGQIEKIEANIIILDMPAVDGIATLRRLKLTRGIQGVPVILLSADSSEDVIVHALDLGAYDYVCKPVIYPVLAARIRAALRLREHQQLLAEANRNLATLASQDPLTGVYNRRHFWERADIEFTQARRHKRSLAVIMLDVDEFKAVNDRYGHSMGDNALIELTMICTNNIRIADFIGRLGGEEFAICCPDADLPGAIRMAERIRSALDHHEIYHQGNSCSVTVSLGVTAVDHRDKNLEAFLDRADQLLYQAKEQGRNRVIAS
ncbi:MAG: diguanylate cyclase [Cellvibrionaceae bacterium]